MYTPDYAREMVYISGSRYMWNNVKKDIDMIVAGLFSHEDIHLTLEKFSHKASVDIDNLFGGSENWGVDINGLGDSSKVFHQYDAYITAKKKGEVD